jgi:hypothetical protein
MHLGVQVREDISKEQFSCLKFSMPEGERKGRLNDARRCCAWSSAPGGTSGSSVNSECCLCMEVCGSSSEIHSTC